MILEFGYFVGKLSRHKVACLLKNPVEQPSKMQDIVYLNFRESLEKISLEMLKELWALATKLTKIMEANKP